MLKTELKEKLKWGKPTYTLNGKLIVGMAEFKNHMALWFHQGVFLKDPHHKLINAQEGVTKALRQWRIEPDDTIDSKIVLEYVEEAIANSKAGKEVKPVRGKSVVIPEILKNAFENDATLKANFQKLTPGKQREYSQYIAEAKREATQQSRLQKSIPMIKKGVGLHDKYKNC
ncbi:YdeI/OmpD-associated family protein [Aequorivita flava]|uniref:YdeI/OmpD-associated family protein n=1 Tax=Aequorivita flava TaxID=3114371 RepID=A0AB35YQW5_9FLAO